MLEVEGLRNVYKMMQKALRCFSHLKIKEQNEVELNAVLVLFRKSIKTTCQRLCQCRPLPEHQLFFFSPVLF